MALDFGIDRRHHDITAITLSFGNLFYLATVGLIATAIIGVFFGVGFLLLVPPGGGAITGAGPQHPVLEAKSVIYGLLPPAHSSDEPPDGEPGPVVITARGAPPGQAASSVALISPPSATDGTTLHEENAAPQSPAAIPADLKALGGVANDTLSFRDGQVEGQLAKGAHNVPAQSATIPDPTSSSPATPSLAPAASRLSAAEISELLMQGDARLYTGDVTSARLFYERAAAAGDGRGALRLGATFDPAFLRRAGLRNVQGDAVEAHSWYNRAVDLGAAEVKR